VIVVNASVALTWYVAEDDSAAARTIFAGEQEVIAPELLVAEITNAICRENRAPERGCSARLTRDHRGNSRQVQVPWARSLPAPSTSRASEVAVRRPRCTSVPSARTGPVSPVIGRTRFTLISSVV
jgi:hypothetical protein